jgi:hypothetical protein
LTEPISTRSSRIEKLPLTDLSKTRDDRNQGQEGRHTKMNDANHEVIMEGSRPHRQVTKHLMRNGRT